MAKNSIRDYSATASQNTDIDSIDIDENCPASNLNNSQRALMAHLKNVSTGAVNLETPAADQLNVDNLRLDGNTISSTDTNGDITLDPNGTGDTIIASGNLGIGDSTPIALLTAVAADGVMADQYVAKFINSEATTGQNYGVFVAGGSSSADESFGVRNFDSSATYFKVRGDGNVGIGTNSPNNNSGRTTLTINNASQGGAIDLEHNGTVVGKFICDGSNTLGIQADGNRDILFKTNGNSRMLLSGNGNFQVGQNGTVNTAGTNSGVNISAQYGTFQANFHGNDYPILNIHTSGGNNSYLHFRFGNSTVGYITTNGSSTTYATSSDHRLKENVVAMTGAIDRVKALAPKRFNFIADPDTTVDGFLAHEAQAVVPEAITGTHNEVETWTQQQIDDGDAPDGTSVGDNKLDGDGNTIPVMQGIDQSKLVPLLTGALQEAIAKIETLETQRADLETRLTALEA